MAPPLAQDSTAAESEATDAENTERFEPVEVEDCDDDHQRHDGADEEDGYGDCDVAKHVISQAPRQGRFRIEAVAGRAVEAFSRRPDSLGAPTAGAPGGLAAQAVASGHTSRGRLARSSGLQVS